MTTTVDVHVDQPQGGTERVGTAFFTRSRGHVTTVFTYDGDYLAGGGPGIDPQLTLDTGSQYVAGLLPAFADSAPDRWGRNLVDKAERTAARTGSRAPRTLDDLDYLLGVSDTTRQGALRFRPKGGSEFVGDDVQIPRLVSLEHLLHAADLVAREDDPVAAVKELLDTGTNGLGGARPKASVRLKDGALAIAKFPHPSDEWDVMAWEATALELLRRAGIATPDHVLAKVGNRSALVLRRFDRAEGGARIGYISAMTVTRSRDGQQRDYSDIAGAMRDISRDLRRDHAELFDRVIASVALGNTDDHLRNHGFLSDARQWTLSPAFDVNPNPDLGKHRATSIAGATTVADEADALLAFAEDCGLGVADARRRMSRVATALADWAECARSLGIAEREVTMMGESIGARLERVNRAAAAGDG